MRLSLRKKIVSLVLLILLIAVGGIAFQGLKFFRSDKTTYIFDLVSQVSSAQTKELDKKLSSLKNMVALFADLASYPLSLRQREEFIKKFADFFYIATFKSQGTYLTNELVIASRQRLAQVGIDPDRIKNDRRIIEWLQASDTWILLNFTAKAGNPIVAVVYRPTAERIAMGLVSQTTLLDLTQSKRVYQTYVVNKTGEVIMHHDGELLLRRANQSHLPMVESWMKNPTLPLTKEFDLEDQSKVLTAYNSLNEFNLGIFVEIPKEQAFIAARRLVKDSSLWALGIFMVCCTLGIWFAYNITRPVKELAKLTTKISQGDFNAKTKVTSKDEIGELAESFNRMSDELKVRDQKIAESSRQLVQSEKMSAFGQMSAGIAHEVKNPLAGILGYAQLAKRKLAENDPVIKHIEIIEKETKRCKEIIDNLMKFARQEKMVFEPLSVNQAVRESLALVNHQLTIHGIKIVEELAGDSALPKVVGNINQLEQVFMNLMLNAEHAMGGKGTLTVRTATSGNNQVTVQVADTGHGIAPENLKKIFEPFFTTKAAGQGTGLGLAVTYGIVKEHRGDITVASAVGQGTTFTITLPTETSAEAPARLAKPQAAAV